MSFTIGEKHIVTNTKGTYPDKTDAYKRVTEKFELLMKI